MAHKVIKEAAEKTTNWWLGLPRGRIFCALSSEHWAEREDKGYIQMGNDACFVTVYLEDGRCTSYPADRTVIYWEEKG